MWEISTFASVNLMVLAQEEVEAQMQVKISRKRPSLSPGNTPRSFIWLMATAESHALPATEWGS